MQKVDASKFILINPEKPGVEAKFSMSGLAASTTFSLSTLAALAQDATDLADLVTDKPGILAAAEGKIVAPGAAPLDAAVPTSGIMFYIDETLHKLMVKVKYSDGTTIKTATIDLA